jgi:predicted nucleic acid-binding protein
VIAPPSEADRPDLIGVPPRAVLDTSVLLSGHRHWLWLLAHQRFYHGIWSPFIIGELVRVRVEHSIAHRVDRPIYRQRINDLMHGLSSVLTVSDYRRVPAGGALRDPDDEPIYATAVAGQAAFIVSLNTRDFPPGRQVGAIQFVTPGEFLAELSRRFPEAALDARAAEARKYLP